MGFGESFCTSNIQSGKVIPLQSDSSGALFVVAKLAHLYITRLERKAELRETSLPLFV